MKGADSTIVYQQKAGDSLVTVAPVVLPDNRSSGNTRAKGADSSVNIYQQKPAANQTVVAPVVIPDNRSKGADSSANVYQQKPAANQTVVAPLVIPDNRSGNARAKSADSSANIYQQKPAANQTVVAPVVIPDNRSGARAKGADSAVNVYQQRPAATQTVVAPVTPPANKPATDPQAGNQYNVVPPAPVVVTPDNAKLEEQIALLRQDIQAYERSNRNYNNNNQGERVVTIQPPLPPVMINNPGTAGTTVHDTIVHYVYDTIRVQADTVIVTDTVEKIVKKEIVKDATRQKLLAMHLEKIMFDVGKSAIRPIYFKGLNFIAKQLHDYPDLKISLRGYTDKTGTVAINQRLSEARANAVKKYLLGRGVKEDQFSVAYFGADDPIDENKTAAGKFMNRRVELSFFE